MLKPVKALTVALLTITAGGLLSCGKIQNVPGYTQREPAPTGAAVLGQGSIIQLRDQEVRGTVAIYRPRTGPAVLRLSGFSAPRENGLQIILTSSIGETLTIPVRIGLTGDLNYPLPSNQDPSRWSQFRIYSPRRDLDYAQAVLLHN